MSKEDKEKKLKKEADEKLNEDAKKCWGEIKPILEKYDLVMKGKLQIYQDGLIALAVFDRKPKEPQPVPQPK